MEYSEAQGTLIHEKKLKSKISCQTPFKRHETPDHWHKGAAWHLIDMVRLYLSPLPVWRRGDILPVQMISTCLCGA